MLLFSMLLILFFLSKKGSFTSTFISLAFLYFCIFYIYPLSLILREDSFRYVGYQYQVTFQNIALASFSAIIFIIGFVLPDFLLILKRRKSRVMSDLWVIRFNNYSRYKIKKSFFIILLLVLGTYLYKYLDPSRALNSYAIRTGESEGSMLTFLYGIIINSLSFSIVFVFIYARKKKSVFFLLLFYVIFLLSGATGRAKLIINSLLLIMYTFKLKIRTVLLSSIFLFITLLPIILNLKIVIYEISVNSRLPNLVDLYFSKPNIDLIIANLGHPLVSLMNANNIIEDIGFRFFYDYLQGFLFYLRVFGIDFGDSLIYINSEYLLGVRKSIIPTGYLAFGYIQLGYIGIIISGLFYRAIGYIAEFVYYRIQIENDIVKFYLSFMAASSFYHGEVRVMVITFFLPILIIYLFRPSKLTSDVS